PPGRRAEVRARRRLLGPPARARLRSRRLLDRRRVRPDVDGLARRLEEGPHRRAVARDGRRRLEGELRGELLARAPQSAPCARQLLQQRAAVDGLLLGEPAGDERCGGRTVDDRRVAKQPFADDGLLALREQLAYGGHLLDDA